MTTIGQIAAKLGVSKATVSRALRGLPSVSPQTIEQVRRTAEEMGYVPFAAAAGLSTGRNYAVGVVVPSLNRWFYSSVVMGIDRVLADAGYDIVLFDLDRNLGTGTRVFTRSNLRRRVDALIVITTVFSEQEFAEFAMLDIPMVAVGPSTPGLRTVGIDDVAVMTASTEHVVALGHRRLGFIGGYDSESLSVVSAAEREHAFMRAAVSAGAMIEPTWMLAAGYRASGAYHAALPVFSGDSWPTALVCASDEMAIGATLAIRAAGLRVPDDVSVIGVDDHEYAALYDLTTFRQDPQEQGAIAARQAIAEVEGAAPIDAFPPAEFTLVLRGSTARPRGAGASHRAT